MEKLSELLEGGGRDGLPVERVGALVHRALTAHRPRTRYTLAPNMLVDWVLPTTLPRRWVDRLFARRLSILRRRPKIT
jgi:hypothetical protein